VRYSRPDLQGEQLFVVALPPGVILLRRLFPSTAPDHSLLRIRLFFLLWLGWNQFFELHAPSPIAHLDSCVLPLADRALACGGPYPRLCSCSCRRRPYDERHRRSVPQPTVEGLVRERLGVLRLQLVDLQLCCNDLLRPRDFTGFVVRADHAPPCCAIALCSFRSTV